VQDTLDKLFLCRADHCFSTALITLTNITGNLECFPLETFQSCLLSVLFVFHSVSY